MVMYKLREAFGYTRKSSMKFRDKKILIDGIQGVI